MASSLQTDVARMFMIGFPGLALDAEARALLWDGAFGAILPPWYGKKSLAVTAPIVTAQGDTP